MRLTVTWLLLQVWALCSEAGRNRSLISQTCLEGIHFGGVQMKEKCVAEKQMTCVLASLFYPRANSLTLTCGISGLICK